MSSMPFPEFTSQARKRWEGVSSWAREKMLESIWCGNGLTGTPMELRVRRMDHECLILEGTCKICGHDVVRLIEPEE